MTDDELLRYSRHILLDPLGFEGQQRIVASRVLMVGAGGLGCAAALYLAASGVGHITVIDDDTVDLTNLQRQIAHTTARVGQPKVASLQSSVAELNPSVQVVALARRADPDLLDGQVALADVVLDCSDNFQTRHILNAACLQRRVPLVSGAALGFDGQISVFDPRLAQSPCYACLYPPHTPPSEARCATLGVFAPLVGILGATQAAEALKLVSGVGQSCHGRLLMLDALQMEWHTIRIRRQDDCPVCGRTGC